MSRSRLSERLSLKKNQVEIIKENIHHQQQLLVYIHTHIHMHIHAHMNICMYTHIQKQNTQLKRGDMDVRDHKRLGVGSNLLFST